MSSWITTSSASSMSICSKSTTGNSNSINSNNNSNTSCTSSAGRPIRTKADVEADVQTKQTQLDRALAAMMQPNHEGTLRGRTRDNRGALMRLIARFEEQLEELKTELFKAACLEMWLEDQWMRVEAQ